MSIELEKIKELEKTIKDKNELIIRNIIRVNELQVLMKNIIDHQPKDNPCDDYYALKKIAIKSTLNRIVL